MHPVESPRQQFEGFQIMASSDGQLGVCPHCETDIHARDVLIEYREVNETGIWADCPNCSEVVHPQ